MFLPLRRKLGIAAASAWVALCTSAAIASTDDERVIVHAAGTSDGVEEIRSDDRYEPDGLEALVAPIALYPDDLLAIVLPASTYPLQIVQAARYLEAHEDDPSLKPDVDWDESVVALLNYPEVVEKLNEDLDWTADLGEAVITQEEAVLDAVNRYRRLAYSRGNLASDGRQRVEVAEHSITIRPADPTVIYVPYYEPRLAWTRHRYPLVRYYSRPCPVYYYPYPAGHYLASRHFWGTTSAFTIAWHTRNLHFHLLEHRSHPYYGYDYAFRHYRYWEPRLYARTFYRDHPKHRYHDGNRWRRHPDYRDERRRRFQYEERKSENTIVRARPENRLRGNTAAVSREQVGVPSREEALARVQRRLERPEREEARSESQIRALRGMQARAAQFQKQERDGPRQERQARSIRFADPQRGSSLRARSGAESRAEPQVRSSTPRVTSSAVARMRFDAPRGDVPRAAQRAPSVRADAAASRTRAAEMRLGRGDRAVQRAPRGRMELQ